MRRLVALGCCFVYLTFGFMAGAAHVHEAADHHEEMRGLHLDHDHLGETSGAPSDEGEAGFDARHVGHHEGDVLYLTVTAQRSLDSGLQLVPAMIALGATIEPAVFVSTRRDGPDRLRGPPKLGLTPSRAPPA